MVRQRIDREEDNVAATPNVRVENIRQAFSDGNHNAFTDLCVFRGDYFLTFRSCPDGHMIFDSSRIVVLRSADGVEWRQVFEFRVLDRDVRDPHFLVFRDKLFVYSGTWLCAVAEGEAFHLNEHLGYGAWSADGESWDGPRCLEGTYGHYIWRAAAHGDKAYLCGRRQRDFVRQAPCESQRDIREAALLESDDGLIWKHVGLFADTQGDETAFLFEDDGSILALHRGSPSLLCRSHPPYTQWQRSDLGRYVGGPMLEKWGEHYLVGGRKTAEGCEPKTTLYWLVNDQLQEVAELPSGGDNSYPGFVPVSETRGLLSYYSSHDGSRGKTAPCAVYLADLHLE